MGGLCRPAGRSQQVHASASPQDGLPTCLFTSQSSTVYLSTPWRSGEAGEGQPGWALGLCAPHPCDHNESLAAWSNRMAKWPSCPPRWCCCPSHQPPISSPQIQERVPRSYPPDSCGLSMSAQRMLGTIFALPRTARAALWGKHGWWCKVGPGKGLRWTQRARGFGVPASFPTPVCLVFRKELREKHLLPCRAQGLPL